MVRQNRALGFSSVILATMLYGFYGVASKLVGVEFGTFFLGWSRALIVIAIVSAYLLVQKRWKHVRPRDYLWFASMCTIGVASFLAAFVSFNHLPIGIALFVYFAAATTTGFAIGTLLFRESFTGQKVCILALSLVGLGMIFFGQIREGGVAYLLLSCLSGVGGAVWQVFSKKVSSHYPLAQIIFIDFSFAALICLPLSFIFAEPVSVENLLTKLPIILLFAAITLGSNSFTLLTFKYLPAQIASIGMLLEVAFGVLFGWLFFQEVLAPLEAAGGAVIVLSVALSYLFSSSASSGGNADRKY